MMKLFHPPPPPPPHTHTHTQLIETLVKIRKTEMSDDSLLLRPDQKKPEAVIREMKAKARSLR